MSARITAARPLAQLAAPIGLLGLSLAATATPAAAQSRLGVDVSAKAGIATNPFLEAGSTPTALSGTIGIRPGWVLERPLSTFRVDGNAEVTFYDKGYSTNENVSVRGSGTHRLSEQTTLNGMLGYVNTIVGTFNGLGIPFGTTLPGTVTTPVTGGSTAVPVVLPDTPGIITDPALGGIGRRRQVYMASGGLSTALSLRDQLSVNMSLSANRSSGTNVDDFNYVTPSIAYNRALGEKLSVGASFAVGFTDYRGTSLGDATIYQPSLTMRRGLSDRWSLSTALGAAIISIEEAGRSRTSTSFNGTADLCRRDERLSACLSVSHQTVPSSFQGVRTQTSGSASLAYRVSARDEISLSGGYSHAGQPIQRDVVSGRRDGSVDFANASGSYSRRFAPALWGNVTVGYAQAFDNDVRRSANVTALAGVTYRFGRQP